MRKHPFVRKAQPMKKEQKQVNQLQSKYLDALLDQAYRAMLEKKGLSAHRPYYDREKDEPASIKRARIAIKQYEEEQQKKAEERWKKDIEPLQRRVNAIKAEVLFLEPRQALALVQAFAKEAGIPL